MNGLIVVNKPINKTSRDVVNDLNHIFGISKIGHTGTLDPLATGVLVCLIGKYTKLVNLITAYDKEYIAEIKVGIETDTGDITGHILKRDNFNLTENQILDVFKNFPKTYDQTVPKYSAVKINGKKLYEYARNNIEINLPTRKVTIYHLELLSYKNDIITFKVQVSKGTYIRSLIADICKNLNIYGTMNNLIRTKQGNFTLDNSYTIDDIKKGNYKLLSIPEFLNYPIIEVDEELLKKIKNGVKIKNTFAIKDKVIFTYLKKEIAIYLKDEDYLRSYIQF